MVIVINIMWLDFLIENNEMYFFAWQVEAGDVILKVNETDVKRFTTKEGKYK